MSQILSQVPRQSLSQQQRLTPQLIQAMDILQLNAMALESRIEQEIDTNPALELAPPDDEVAPPPDTSPDEPADGEQIMKVADGAPEEFARLDRLVSEYDWIEDDEFRRSRSRARGDEQSDAKHDALANTAARGGSLQEALLAQWNLADLGEPTHQIGIRLIDYVDENGRITTPLSEIARELPGRPSVDDVELALIEMQERFEPAGLCARSLQECLSLQLERMPGNNALEKRIVAAHLDDLQKNRRPHIAKALNVSLEDVNAAVEVIGALSFNPAAEVVERTAPTITPDLIAEYDAETGGYDVRLTRANQRELRISAEFREALEGMRGDRGARDFIRQKLDAASQLIDAVRFRRDRLLEVGKAAVEAQREFLEKGDTHLRVLHMSDLAERLRCDPSTISRTVDEKYIQTPRGAIALRRFFTTGADSDNGDSLGWESVRAKVEEIVAGEDKTDPLNDDEIVARLREQGIDVKRRTIAKYRAQLNIPASKQRKQF